MYRRRCPQLFDRYWGRQDWSECLGTVWHVRVILSASPFVTRVTAALASFVFFICHFSTPVVLCLSRFAPDHHRHTSGEWPSLLALTISHILGFSRYTLARIPPTTLARILGYSRYTLARIPPTPCRFLACAWMMFAVEVE